ncbi:MAG: amidase [Dehalococcoidia bacterium]|nr:amidase [Dehalococcoidia bacterium]
MAFHLQETTIEAIQQAYKSGELSARDLVQLYLNRIEAYDHNGPAINAIINVAADALEQADRLDAAYRSSGPVGPLHGVPVILKDQMDAKGMPTTLGSILLKDYHPDRDSFVAEKLRRAGAIILAKTTLGELGGGDTHGTLFGSTRNPWDLERTAGGSSGGSGAGVSANFAAIGIGQEGFASIRRPSAWNGIVGMRPTAGLVSRGGVYDGWPGVAGSLGPMARTVRDVATLLDVMVGYDPEDPLTVRGIGKVPTTYTRTLDPRGLQGARIGIIREPMGRFSEPGTEDFNKVAAVFDAAVADLRKGGATLVDPLVIPELAQLIEKRGNGDRGGSEGRWDVYYGRSARRPYQTMAAMLASPGYKPKSSGGAILGETAYEHLLARETLMFNVLKAMADNQLDAIVHRTVEHQPTLIRDGVNPPFVNTKGVTHINTFLVYVSSMSVPAGYTSDGLPVGITFLGRGYDEPAILKVAYGYEQATMHRKSPPTTPALVGEP